MNVLHAEAFLREIISVLLKTLCLLTELVTNTCCQLIKLVLIMYRFLNNSIYYTEKKDQAGIHLKEVRFMLTPN